MKKSRAKKSKNGFIFVLQQSKIKRTLTFSTSSQKRVFSPAMTNDFIKTKKHQESIDLAQML